MTDFWPDLSFLLFCLAHYVVWMVIFMLLWRPVFVRFMHSSDYSSLSIWVSVLFFVGWNFAGLLPFSLLSR